MDAKPGLAFALRIGVGCALAVFLGYWIDSKLNTSPFIMLFLLAYVIIGSFYLLLKETKENE